MKVFLVFYIVEYIKPLIKQWKGKVDTECNRFIHLGDSMVMYGIYNGETLENLINTVYEMHNTTTPNEKLFAGELSTAFPWYVNKNCVHHYALIHFYIWEH